jgi:hypothetical protein
MGTLRIVMSIAALVGCLNATEAQESTRLLCEYKQPLGQEAAQQHVLEIDLPKKWIYSQMLVDGKPSGRLIPFKVAVENETMLVGTRTDDSGKLTDDLSINRLTADASFGWYVYGAARDKVWDDRKRRMGGFEEDPVKLTASVMRCRPAVKQF